MYFLHKNGIRINFDEKNYFFPKKYIAIFLLKFEIIKIFNNITRDYNCYDDSVTILLQIDAGA